MRTARAWRRGPAILALTLLLTGCLKLDMALTISPDDTVDGELVFAVNKELLELTGQSVDDFLGQTQVPSDVPGATQELYEDDRFVGTRVVFDSVPLAELQQESATDSLSIVREGDRFVVSGVLDLSTADQELQGNPFEDQIQQAFDSAELRVAVTFPGEVIETNGQVDGTTVVWEPRFGVRTKMTAVASATGEGSEAAGGNEGSGGAEASVGGSGGNAVLWVILGLAVVAGVVALFLVMRRRGASAAGGGMPAPGAGLPGVAASSAPSAGAATAPIPPAPVPPAPPHDSVSGESAASADDTTEPIGRSGDLPEGGAGERSPD